jgi:hypothetical protein
MPKVAIPAVLQDAVTKFRKWSEQQQASEQAQNTIETPLYHYTDGRGLKGIIESGKIWFSDYRHLNDPSELVHGIGIAHDVAHRIPTGSDGRVRLFLDTLVNMFSHQNFSATLEFFIASFSRKRDDLYQWLAYADDGRGFAIGFAPRMFRIVEDPPTDKLGEYVGPVLYNIDEVFARHHLSIEEAASIFLDTVNRNADLVEDKSVGLPFMQEMAREIIASPLIWNCLTSKNPAYAHEEEVRLIILGQRERLSPYVTTRLRGSDVVPYIAHPMSVREPQNIAEIVVGPAALSDAEHNLRALLASQGVDTNIPVNRSDIPYRAL